MTEARRCRLSTESGGRAVQVAVLGDICLPDHKDALQHCVVACRDNSLSRSRRAESLQASVLCVTESPTSLCCLCQALNPAIPLTVCERVARRCWPWATRSSPSTRSRRGAARCRCASSARTTLRGLRASALSRRLLAAPTTRPPSARRRRALGSPYPPFIFGLRERCLAAEPPGAGAGMKDVPPCKCQWLLHGGYRARNWQARMLSLLGSHRRPAAPMTRRLTPGRSCSSGAASWQAGLWVA